jgi:hypothetical protein
MFLPHLVSGQSWLPLSHSREAAEVLISARQSPLLDTVRPLAPWESVYQRLGFYSNTPSGFDEAPRALALKQELAHIRSHRSLAGRRNFFWRIIAIRNA